MFYSEELCNRQVMNSLIALTFKRTPIGYLPHIVFSYSLRYWENLAGSICSIASIPWNDKKPSHSNFFCGKWIWLHTDLGYCKSTSFMTFLYCILTTKNCFATTFFCEMSIIASQFLNTKGFLTKVVFHKKFLSYAWLLQNVLTQILVG